MFHSPELCAAFDGVRAHNPADSHVSENARWVALDHVQRQYPRCAAALLFGSFARGNFGAFSDIDLIVIDRGCTTPSLELGIVEGFRIEVFSFSPKDLIEVLQIQARQGLKVFASAIAEGELVCGDATLAADLKARSRKIAGQGSAGASDDIERARIRLTYWLAKLEYIEDEFDRLYIASLVLNLIMSTWLLAKTGETMSHELLPRVFHSACPQLSSVLRESYLALARSGNARSFQTSCLDVLSQIGGAIWSGARVYIM